ncbi:NAD(P)-binding domain-containing protein [Metabacillus arenae]|uniref:FAD/NAD(P)-binding protein n=1 Tax=Metabacillus arenae TaxID=2771434 RepID=A0A926RX92_9BACI|nr:FAD/NAD(P)-binding protein [Metabacillus arenae]MBD1380761.1 FAD/NAD(P)-binding protein [Metabacillus arenae]
MYEWIIIGGGIQGCTLAVSLIKSGNVSADNLMIIDPHEEPISQWKRNTERIEMKFLRSPSVHHLDLAPFSLQKFAREADFSQPFYGYYKRPSLSLFHEHCDSIFREIDLKRSWHRGRVSHLERKANGWWIKTEENSWFHTKYVAIASGFTEALNYPTWSKEVKKMHPHLIYHIFEKEVPETFVENQPLVIVGAGITAAHLSIKLSKKHDQVVLVTRHPFRIHDFDSDPGWLGPKNMNSFSKIKNYNIRRSTITNARYRGSFPKELSLELSRLIQKNKLKVIKGEIESCSKFGESTLQLNLKNSKEKIETSQILLATGFESNMEFLTWLQSVIKNEMLLCSKCGFPIVSKNLKWGGNLYVVGALAELEVGPTARNISGARTAAHKIVSSL